MRVCYVNRNAPYMTKTLYKNCVETSCNNSKQVVISGDFYYRKTNSRNFHAIFDWQVPMALSLGCS